MIDLDIRTNAPEIDVLVGYPAEDYRLYPASKAST
jgi:hypothetical protein